jgi:crotonobetainyl-CoA:carnitine CoA-transferase CaiB-like acyl-CoA transferase
MNTDHPRPLAGSTVLDFTSAWAGPLATRMLASFGARVIKIEGPRKLDSWRGGHRGVTADHFPDHDPGDRPYDRNSWFNTQNRGKLSVGVDLKAAGARDVVLRIAELCDVVVANFSPGALTKLGLSYDDIRSVRPDVIYADMPALANDGPYGHHVGMGQTMEAASGMTSLMGYSTGAPMLTGYAYLDPIGGLNGAAAVMAAIEYRRVTGLGQYIEVPQVEAAMQFIAAELAAAFDGGPAPPPDGNQRAGELVHDAFRCRGQDEWVAIACDPSEWESLRRVVGDLPDLRDCGCAAAGQLCPEHDQLTRAGVVRFCGGRDKHQVAETLQAAGVRAAPVNKGKDLAEDPHLRARGFFEAVAHRSCGTHLYPGLPHRFSGTPGGGTQPAPCFGEHSQYVLRELCGFSDAEFDALFREGVIADAAVLD